MKRGKNKTGRVAPPDSKMIYKYLNFSWANIFVICFLLFRKDYETECHESGVGSIPIHCLYLSDNFI